MAAEASQPAPPARVRMEVLQQNRVMLMQAINLPALLPVLVRHGVFTPEETDRLRDEHHTSVERLTFLLQYISRKGQSTVDEFVQCLREETRHRGHQEILQLLEKSASDRPEFSPVLAILDAQLEVIVKHLDVNSIAQLLADADVIPRHNVMDVTNPQRTPQEQLSRLIRVVQSQGVQGMVGFLRCLQEDLRSTSHQKLAQILLEQVQNFFKSSPDRNQVTSADRIALLQLKTRGEISGRTLEEEFERNRAKLMEGIDLPVLLPALKEREVLSAEEAQKLTSEQPPQRNKQLLEMARSKGALGLLGLLECLRENPEHKELANLFEASPGPAKPTEGASSGVARRKVPLEKTDRLAVFITMDEYVALCPVTYRPKEKTMADFNKDFRQHKQELRACLERLHYDVVDFRLTEEGEEESGAPERAMSKEYTSRVGELFQKQVVGRCNEGAVVFIHISGIQFPFREQDRDPMRHDSYQGAVLIHGSSELSRKRLDCLRAQDLCHWVEQLPTEYITFLIDCHLSHVVRFGKNEEPREVEIMEDPWRLLTSLQSSTVVYYARPDSEAMGRQLGQESSKKSHFGLLTEIFVHNLKSWIRSQRSSQEVVTHRLFYEAVSFHWHKHGRVHLLYNPAVQGDVDRAFLSKTSHPYHQVFRANLIKIDPSTSAASQYTLFQLKAMQIATGTMAGLIRGDELQVFHVLRPEMVVSGRVTKANPLSAIAEIHDEDIPRFTTLLFDIYEANNGSRDGSTEFVLVKKRFPLHQQEQYAVFVDREVGESDAETIKAYVRQHSMLLSLAPNKEKAKMVVKKEGEFYLVDDVARDVRPRVKVKRIQLVKSMLESVAWFKYVKGLKQPLQKPLYTHTCHMTAEKPLLSKSTPQCLEYQLRCTSHAPNYPIEEGAVLEFSDHPKFWVPSVQDQRPCLEIAFRQNHVITAVEIRGDPEEEKYVEQGVISYQKLVDTAEKKVVFEGPADMTATRVIDLHCQEPVKFVTIVPESWARGKSFNLMLRMSHKTASTSGQKRTATYYVDGMTVVNWPFYKHKWTFVPTPHQDTGRIAPKEWLSWTGSSYDPVTFDLTGGFLLDKLEITVGDTGASALERFRLELHTQWQHKELPPIQTVWPLKHYFQPTPLLASNLQLWPVHIHGDLAKVQLQFFGNKHREALVVEEGDLLSLHFTNTGHSQLFVYVFCLEETGEVRFVLMDVVNKGRSRQKYIKTYIPDDYAPASRQIVDLYKVFVSQSKIYLEPFVQRGLTNYHRTCCYSVCSMGRKSDLGKDEQWYEYEFTVKVKQASHLSSHAS